LSFGIKVINLSSEGRLRLSMDWSQLIKDELEHWSLRVANKEIGS
jgi:hypothetical protein